MTKGFVTIATGREEYYKLASNLLASYKYHTTRPMPWAILCDEENEYTRQFDDVILLKDATRSLWDKMFLLDRVPYDESIFIEADCLAYRDLNGLWKVFRKAPDFGCLGDVLPMDSPVGFLNPSHLGKFSDKVDHQYVLQGGVYFFRKSPLLERFSETCHDIHMHFSEYQFRVPTEEAVYTLASAAYGFEPVSNWFDVFCFLPDSDIIEMDLRKGALKFTWKLAGWRIYDGKYLVHWTTEGTRGDLYRREADAAQSLCAEGVHPSFSARMRMKGIRMKDSFAESFRQSIPRSLRPAFVWGKKRNNN